MVSVMKWFLVLLLVLGSLVAGCKPAETNVPGRPSANTPDGARTFYVKGVVRDVRVEGRTVRIQHEEIPGYMEAMTMPFSVKDETELAGLEPGMTVLFRLVVTADDSWIDEVTRLPEAAPAVSLPEPRRVRYVDPVEEGQTLPDYPLTNQLGQPIRLSDYRGQVLAFTFIYTRCPLPNFCPRMTSHFLEVQAQLPNVSDVPERWQLLTVSFDPDHDTPQVLRDYAARNGADPDRWQFATGAREEVDALTEQFGLSYGRTGETFDHNLRTVVVAPDGVIRRILIGNEWQPADLMTEIVAAGKPVAAGGE
jgi:protein SCO1/2